MKELDFREANQILKHLKETNQAWCFLKDGRLVSRDDCLNVLFKVTKETEVSQ